MKIIVGLGNPGEEYSYSRHNAGWLVLEKIIQNENLKFEINKKFNAELSEMITGDEKIVFVKPLTFMNASGKAVKQLVKWSNDKMVNFSENLWVIHDEIDFPLGQIKIVKNRASAGHKGVESIINELGAQDFVRFRIGVGKPSGIDQKEFVLDKPRGEERELFEKSINIGQEAVLYALDAGLEKAMNKYN